jgi:hypothetical protein
MTRRRITGLALTLSLALTALFAGSARADHHLVKIREVHNGVGVAGDYVVIQMYEAGQNLFGGHYLRFLAADGNVLAEYPLNNAPNGQSQRTYQLGNGVAGADQNEAGVNVAESGAVCYNTANQGTGGIDCVSWGTFAQTAGVLSSPALPPFGSGLGSNQSIVRGITRGCPTALDEVDDTNNSAADFAIGAPLSRPNAVTPPEKLCTPVAPTAKKCKKKKKKKKGASAAAKKKKKRCGKKKKKKK